MTHHVWSWDARNQAWIEVDQGSEAEAITGAHRRNATARQYGIDATFVALPSGITPSGAPGGE